MKIRIITALILLVPLGWTQSPAPNPATPSSQSGDIRSNLQNLPAGLDSAPGSSKASEQNIEALIGPGDLLKISVLGAPDYDQELRVSGGGDISLALLGQIHVAGLTPEQVQQMLRTRLKESGYFADPQVSVFQKEYATQGVSVLGEVLKPGVYPLLGPHRLFDVISLAGGTTPKAGQLVTIAHRNQPQATRNVTLSNDPAKNTEANVDIMPGDTVVVSKAGIVYVVGDVHRPSGVIMENGNLTVLQAIAMAEGANPSAALNSAKIIRRSDGGPKEIHLELKKMLAAKSPDVKLQAEDIIFVPSSAAKSAGKTALDSIVRLATGVAVYRLP